MASEVGGRRNSNTQLLEELETLSQSLYVSSTAPSSRRRTASLALPRSSLPSIPSSSVHESDPPTLLLDDDNLNFKPRSRRMSLSPWRSRPPSKAKDDHDHEGQSKAPELNPSDDNTTTTTKTTKASIWNWKPIRALSHIGMHKLSCLFSVEVVSAQGLPPSMNGLRLSICVRKKETKDGAVHTMPSRVSQGAADFEETLFLKCHVYCTQPSAAHQPHQLKFEPRPFLIYVFAVDAAELDFGRNSVDLSRLIQESLHKNAQGTRIRQWDTRFDLAGKAKGGQLLLKFSFQIMEKDGGIGLFNFNQLEELKSGKPKTSISTFGRKQSKSSFSIPSPKISSRMGVWTPSHTGTTPDIQGLDELNLDDPAPTAPPSLPEPPKSKEAEEDLGTEEVDLPELEFEVVDKGVEIESTAQETEETDKEEFTVKSEERSESSEVVKEIVDDHHHRLTMLTELDSIAQQIKALESMMIQEEEEEEESKETKEESFPSHRLLDAEEESVTMEFLQMLEGEKEEKEASEHKQFQFHMPPLLVEVEQSADVESKVLLPDLGKGLGCVVQTRNGGFLAAANPFNVEMSRKDTPKLAMQISKPLVITTVVHKSIGGFELFQRMAAVGLEELSSEMLTLMPIEELMGKTAEQVAFEGIASAIISGRNKEGASSSAARSLAAVKKMASAMSMGRKERIATGIWNVSEDPLTADEILAFSMQKIEAMSIDALKIQAEMAEEDAPFDVSPLSGSAGQKDQNHPLASAIPLEHWVPNTTEEDSESITVAMAVQLRDPLRRYEAVGGPLMALIQADTKREKYDDNFKFRLSSLHVGGIKVQSTQKRNPLYSEKQRLTAMQWLIAYNMARPSRKRITPVSKEKDLLWSISSRVVADMWLKPIRNPDVKFTK